MRDHILAVLIGFGSETDRDGLRVLASVIEQCAYRPELGLSDIIDGYASANGLSRQYIERLIEKHLNVYDADKFARIQEYTNTVPITHKDALYDIAVAASVEFSAFGQKR